MASPNTPQLNITSPYALTERLWFNNSAGTNYQLWKTLHHFQRQGLIGFLDGSNLPPHETLINPIDCKRVRNADYDIWRRTDESLKQGILSLLEDGIAPAELDTESTSRDIWLYLETKFQKHLKEFPPANGSGGDAITKVAHNPLLRDWDEYSQLYSAALLGDWMAAQQIFSTMEPNKINATQATALHVAVGAGEIAIDFVEKLVDCMSHDLIAVKDAGGNTALSIAAAVGNVAAATILVDKRYNLLLVPNILGDFPVHVAAKHARRDVLVYLISVTMCDCTDQNPCEGLSGLALLTSTIEAGFYDIALYLVKKYPYLARLRLSANSALKCIVEQKFQDDYIQRRSLLDSLFASYFLQQHSSPALLHPSAIGSDIESLNISPPGPRSLAIPLLKPCEVSRQLSIKRRLVIEIVKCLCKEMKSSNFIEAEGVCRDAILIAAKLGNHEIVQEIVEAFPSAIYCSNPSFLQSIFRVAVENRYERVFNIVYQVNDHKHLYLDLSDIHGNNLLHLVATLAPSHKLNALPNAAIRMQHEMRWYKEVEKLIHPRCREQRNSSGKSPRMIFEEEHEKLREEGEKWVKDTVDSCTITAALISTITFAAVITVPGGNDSSTGFPMFGRYSAFVLFLDADAFSLITAVLSLLIFLDISTSRYKEEDFIYYVPTRVVIGMWWLIVSITSMMLTFGAMLRLVLDRKHSWDPISLALLVCFVGFIFLEYLLPIILDFIKSIRLTRVFLGKIKGARRPSCRPLASSGNKIVRYHWRSASHESV